MTRVTYLTLEDALAVHVVAVTLAGGSQGVRLHNVLLGCLERPKAAFGGNDMYKNIFEKASVYIDSIARNHPFIDGNKRTSFLCAARFLSLNGYHISMPNPEIVRGMLWVVIDHPSITEIARWLQKHSHKA